MRHVLEHDLKTAHNLPSKIGIQAEKLYLDILEQLQVFQANREIELVGLQNERVFDGIGDTEMGGLATPDMTSSLAETTLTISAANVSGNPTGVLNISLVPEAHGTDAIRLLGAWIEYTKKLPV